jgi:serine/threonine-protein kinase RsbW
MRARASRPASSPAASSTSERREWTIASDVNAITPLVAAVQLLCEGAGFSARHCRFNIPVAVTEALANAIVYGNTSDPSRLVRVGLVVDSQQLVVEVTDEGDGFDAEGTRGAPDAPDWLEREEGRGIFLMRSLMTDVVTELAREPRGHTVRLTLHRT